MDAATEPPDPPLDSMVTSSVTELRRLLDEFERRFAAGEYAAAQSALMAVALHHQPLASHVQTRWMEQTVPTVEPIGDPAYI